MKELIEKLKGKYVFFDIDGTLSEYRFRDKVYDGKCPELGCQNLNDFLFNDLFLKARPLKTMQEIISQLDSDKIFILGTVVCNNEIEQKYIWLKKYFPNFKKENIIFISYTMLKPEVILEYRLKYKLNLNDIVFVDDRMDVIRKAEELGITAYHPSSFIK